MSKNNLSPKQQSFINAYLQTGNATEAAMQVYNTSKRSVAAQIGYENLRKPDIKQAIQGYFERVDQVPVYVVEMLADVWKNGAAFQKLEVGRMFLKIYGLI